ncbi:MAG: hypothetical protein ACRD0W_23560 [Acidimicrobiales bacterium]
MPQRGYGDSPATGARRPAFVLRRAVRPAGATDQLVDRLWVAVRRLPKVVAAVAAAAGLALIASGHSPLGAATLGLAATVYALLAITVFWDRLDDPHGPSAGGRGAAFRGPAAALVTLQGVVLALVLTLAGDDPSLTVRVAGVALVVGVLLGLLQAGLVAIDATSDGQTAIATILFNLMLWACAYGLLCLAAELVLGR